MKKWHVDFLVVTDGELRQLRICVAAVDFSAAGPKALGLIKKKYGNSFYIHNCTMVGDSWLADMEFDVDPVGVDDDVLNAICRKKGWAA